MKTTLVKEIWNLLSWLSILRARDSVKGGLRLDTVRVEKHEMVLENLENGFMFNFSLDDITQVMTVNTVLCLWANRGISATEDSAGHSVFDDVELVESE